MKRTFLAGLIALVLAACGGGSDTIPTAAEPQDAAVSSTPSADPALFGPTAGSTSFVRSEPQAPNAALASVAPIHH